MIYPCIICLAPLKQVIMFSLSRSGVMGGPYTISSWYDTFKDLRPDQCAFAFCAFADGTKPITMEEHHERLLQGEDASLGVFNMFCNSCSFMVGTAMDNEGKFDLWKNDMDNHHKSRIYDYTIKLFPLAMKKALDDGQNVFEKVEQHLKLKFQGDEFDFLNRKEKKMSTEEV